jgi:hypothetical protein
MIALFSLAGLYSKVLFKVPNHYSDLHSRSSKLFPYMLNLTMQDLTLIILKNVEVQVYVR